MKPIFKINLNNCYHGILLSQDNKAKSVDITCMIQVDGTVYAVYKNMAYLVDMVEEGDTIFISKGNEIEVATEFIDKKIEKGHDVKFMTPLCYFPRPSKTIKRCHIS